MLVYTVFLVRVILHFTCIVSLNELATMFFYFLIDIYLFQWNVKVVCISRPAKKYFFCWASVYTIRLCKKRIAVRILIVESN